MCLLPGLNLDNRRGDLVLIAARETQQGRWRCGAGALTQVVNFGRCLI
jgi:hypothetical protein